MKQDHKIPTQNEIDGYIKAARIMRAEVLASEGKRLFQFPAKLMKSLKQRTVNKNPMISRTS